MEAERGIEDADEDDDDSDRAGASSRTKSRARRNILERKVGVAVEDFVMVE